METMYLVDNIRRYCKQNDITTAELEKTLKFSVGLISRWTRVIPSLDKVIMVARYFNVSLDDLLRHPEMEGNDTLLPLLQTVTEEERIVWKSFDQNSHVCDNIAGVVDISENDVYVCAFNEGFFFLVKDKSESSWRFYIVADDNSGPVQWEAGEEDIKILGQFVEKSCFENSSKEKANRLVEKFIGQYGRTDA